MSHDNFDDGLVHAHAWATQAPTTYAMPRRPAGGAPAAAEERFDDGLVHSHGWACAERGRAKHG